MKHAFLIIAHRNWNQLSRMLSIIDSEKADFFIHVNSKVKIESSTIEKVKSSVKKSKVYFTDCVPITWGDFGICKASLVLLKTAKTTGEYDYYHLLTESDLLLKNIDEFDDFFEKHLYDNGSNKNYKTNYISGSQPNKKFASRVIYYNFFIPLWRSTHPVIRKMGTASSTLIRYLQKLFGVNRWKKNEITLFHGLSWWSITDDFASYYLERGNWAEKQFGRNTFAADEYVPQTVFFNSPFKQSIVSDSPAYQTSLRLVDWKRGNGYGSPHIWTIGDKAEIEKTGNLIGRKFDESVDREIVELIFEKISI